MKSERAQFLFGMVVSVFLVVLTLVTWGLGMIAIPPAGPYCPGDCMAYPFSDLLTYYPRDYFWMYLSIFQLFAWLMFMAVQHHLAPAGAKLFSLISLAFALISSTVLLLAYFVQFSVVPVSVMYGETDGIALLTQYNGHGIFIAMEELGYITMSLAFLFLSFIYTGKGSLEKSIRIILQLSFLLMVVVFVFYAFRYGIERNYRFEVAAISVNWFTTILSGILIGMLFRRRISQFSE